MKHIVILSDTHFGSVGGLLPPDFVNADGVPVALNIGQKYLWKCWLDFCSRIKEFAPVAVIINGDVVEGTQAKEGGLGLSLRLMADQKAAAIVGLQMLKSQLPDNCALYFTQGCVTPGHKILRADLCWVPIESIEIGDKIISPSERGVVHGHRKWELATVTNVIPIEKECCEIGLDDGNILISTLDHPWLTYSWKAVKWTKAVKIRPGYRIPELMPVWDIENDYRAGWISGFFDGEASLNQKNYGTKYGRTHQITACQNIGPSFYRAVEYLKEFQVDHYLYPRSNGRDNCIAIQLAGGMPKILEFLGRFRPVRLLNKFDPSDIGYIRSRRFRTVKYTRLLGKREVVGLSTSSGTYLVNGYGSHNTKYHVGDCGEAEEDIAGMIGAKQYYSVGTGRLVREVLWLNVDGVIIEAMHGIGGTSGFYRATAMDREMQWSAMAGKDASKGMPKADLIVRSHVHFFVNLEHASKQAFICPCWQLQMRYARRASLHRMIPDIGGVFVEVDAEAKKRGEPPCRILKQLYDLPPVPVTKL